MGRCVPVIKDVQLVYLTDTPENRIVARCAFEHMEADGMVSTVFYDGDIESPDGFERFLFRPGTLPFAIFGDIATHPVGMAWVNNIVGRAGHGHIAVFRCAWGRRSTERITSTIFRFLLHAHDAAGYLFDVLIGICPESNALVWKLGEACGAVRRCVIPNYIYRQATGISENAVLYTVTRENLRG